MIQKPLTAWTKHGWYRVADVAHLEHVQLAAHTLVDTLLAVKKLPPAAVVAIEKFQEASK